MKQASDILKNSGYQNQIQSGEWKDFSKRIREQRGNFCQMCKRKDVATQVHHWFYDPNRALWQYTGEEVVVLCRSCHQQIHEHLNNFRKFVFVNMTPQVFRVLNGALSVAFEKYEPLVFAHALAEFVSNPSLVQRYADAWDRSIHKETEEQKAFKQFKRSMTGDITAQTTAS